MWCLGRHWGPPESSTMWGEAESLPWNNFKKNNTPPPCEASKHSYPMFRAHGLRVLRCHIWWRHFSKDSGFEGLLIYFPTHCVNKLRVCATVFLHFPVHPPSRFLTRIWITLICVFHAWIYVLLFPLLNLGIFFCLNLTSKTVYSMSLAWHFLGQGLISGIFFFGDSLGPSRKSSPSHERTWS